MLASILQLVGLVLIVAGFALWIPALGLAAFGGMILTVAVALENR